MLQQIHGNQGCYTVIFTAGRKRITQGKNQFPIPDRFRKIIKLFRIRRLIDNILTGHAQKIIPALFLDQVGQACPVPNSAQPLIIKRKQDIIIHQDIPAPDPVFHGFKIPHQFAVMIKKTIVAAAKLPLHQSRLDENYPGLVWVNAAVIHLAAGHNAQAEKGHLFIDDDMASFFFPVRRGVTGMAEISGQRLQPVNLDRRHTTTIEFGSLNQFSRHDPLAAPVELT